MRVFSKFLVIQRAFMSSSSSSSKKHTAAIHWFRKGLRLHDNPSLVHALSHATHVYPVFVIDPWFARPDKVGINRYNFLLQSLADLDQSLRAVGSRLYVARGRPEEQLPALVARWKVGLVTYEQDTEPYAVTRDAAVSASLTGGGCVVRAECSHTLHDIEHYVAASKGKVPSTYQSFAKLFGSMPAPRAPVERVTAAQVAAPLPAADLALAGFDVPTLAEMGYTEGHVSDKFPGGETEALRRLRATVIDRAGWVAEFQKPETSPNALEPATTVLSPYLKFGCLSPALFYHELEVIKRASKKPITQPPVSLHGQLMWREFFYLCSVTTPNFGKMVGNPKCKQIPWDHDEAFVEAFKNARTGYPYIDAIMTQLRQEGWIHHLARHSVACFFTRGDLWQSWEKGAEIFDLYLLDADWAINNANWQWLSCSNFFFQYFRCYSPVAFGKKTDKNGDYIRKYVPQLAKYPAKFIYEPWKAPLSVQQECGCLVGSAAHCGYPAPIVDHDVVSQANMGRMKAAYAAAGGGGGGGEGDEESPAASAGQKRKPSASSSSSSSSSSPKKAAADKKTPSVAKFFGKK